MDEIHERTADTEFLLLIVRKLFHSQWQGSLVLMSATVDSSVLESYFHPIVNSKPYFVGAKRFVVTECFMDNITSFTSFTVENASSQRFHKSIRDHLSELPKECPIMMCHSKVKLNNKVLIHCSQECVRLWAGWAVGFVILTGIC